MTAERTYPYKAWALQPSFKPVEVEIVKAWTDRNWVQAQNGKLHREEALFPTKEAAIAYGWEQVARIQQDLDKRTENLRKKCLALNKAAARDTPIT
jgi:hypothetical protein